MYFTKKVSSYSNDIHVIPYFMSSALPLGRAHLQPLINNITSLNVILYHVSR